MQKPEYDKNTLKFYGRRKGKKLRTGRLGAYEDFLPTLRIELPEQGMLDLPSLFDTPVREIWLEIGFGTGEQLLHLAQAYPNVGMIGCEPFINGVASLCLGVKTADLKNVRVWPEDARLFTPRLPDSSIDRFFLLNADPWPKTRHAKRRYVQKESLDEIHRFLKPGGMFIMSTDDPGLAAWEIEKTYTHGGFAWQAESADDWRIRPTDMIETRYQKKGAGEDRPTVFLIFTKV